MSGRWTVRWGPPCRLRAEGTRPASQPHRDRDANEEVIHQQTPTAAGEGWAADWNLYTDSQNGRGSMGAFENYW